MKKLIFMTILVILVLAVSSACTQEAQNIVEDESNQEELSIYGQWASEKGTLFDLGEDGRYGYYRDKNDMSDYYYKGPLTIVHGRDAMEELGITQEEYERTYKEYAGNENNIFAVKMHFEILHSEGIDKSGNLDKEDYYYYTFIISDENNDHAIAINMTDFNPIEVSRIN